MCSWGQSAGAVSVMSHIVAYDGNVNGLFRGAVMVCFDFWFLACLRLCSNLDLPTHCKKSPQLLSKKIMISLSRKQIAVPRMIP